MNSDELAEQLFAAAETGDVEELSRLLATGAGVHARDAVDDTPLIAAAEAGHLAAVERLLVAGSDVAARDQNGWTALIAAAGEFHVEVVRLLLDWRSDPNVRAHSGLTALHYCLLYDGERPRAQIELLLKRGASPNSQDDDGDTPLMNATRDPEIVRLMLRHGADVRLRNRAGKTALQVAWENCHIESAELIEEAEKAWSGKRRA